MDACPCTQRPVGLCQFAYASGGFGPEQGPSRANGPPAAVRVLPLSVLLSVQQAPPSLPTAALLVTLDSCGLDAYLMVPYKEWRPELLSAARLNPYYTLHWSLSCGVNQRPSGPLHLPLAVSSLCPQTKVRLGAEMAS
ncbi:hypothetical protein SKAU_G00324200 [Synaphobranchus kaupii]|uniref:Uncharacterized protein n=1 Tax=Synaphobranchus kaupii TaxID=118154 RepID=A0A9Q1EPB4_SYNKA|nr:hypothetical protein SKAU_G00324200 [Synaphobranchus kaupii]